MSADFVHLVLTRFNTAVGYAPSARRLESGWLRERINLFERYCLPSMRAQRDAEFRWVVFCDAASPEWFRETMESYRTTLTPFYVEGWLTDDRIAQTIADSRLARAPYLITTRLDNDDALARDHLARVQSTFHQQEREFIEFPFGLQTFRGHLYSVYWHSNPFLSLIERVGAHNRFSTVFCMRHDHLNTRVKPHSIVCAPQWLQVLHANNVGNSLRGWPRIQSRTHSHFAVKWPDSIAEDSFWDRVGLSTAAYSERARRWWARRPRNAAKTT
jgi:putative rhamnosyltransferase